MIANSGQRWCKVRAKMQVYLRSLPNRSLSYAKMAQTESRTSSLLVRYAEVKPILCKDGARWEQRCKFTCDLCRTAVYLMQRWRKPRVERQACLSVMPRWSLSYAKIAQTEWIRENSFGHFAWIITRKSLLVIFVKTSQTISKLYKRYANECRFWKLENTFPL